ncbi:hypothetical protein [Hymenobacter properus]|uniref:DUF4251 domain-containing protein n=1 Tax=Hymenobacter properus TaxID=2791026 RepID=A0A931FI83_9BACT|nr:hypothetical protein [Hymenobacter properus]MBF9140503.1 hypothetical protein [Hymenobacter properus]MBR7719310.1 hypothetical protein [Microvirga sp. SRT04]
MKTPYYALLLAALAGPAFGQSKTTKKLAPPVATRSAAPATRSVSGSLPAKFFGTYTYTVYLIYEPKYSSKPTNTRGVGGTLTLGSAGRYEKKLTFPGPYGTNHFDEAGSYTIKGNNIEFTYSDSKGKPVTYGGTFNYNEPALALSMILNQEADGGREVFGLVVKGSETVKRTFNDDGTVKMGD